MRAFGGFNGWDSLKSVPKIDPKDHYFWKEEESKDDNKDDGRESKEEDSERS